jgi:6,7-dimethyl-8-ribityllumazine synthase
MIRRVEGSRDGHKLRIGVAVASFNQAITDRLLSGALQALEGMEAEDVVVLSVPGALELPIGAAALADHGCHAVVAIGAVVKGETDHYDVVVRESAAGLAQVAIDRNIPVANGIVAVHEYQHALDRSEPGPGNTGAHAAEVAVSLANALRGL